MSVSSGGVSVVWQSLRTNDAYRVESTTNLNPSAWVTRETFSATSGVQVSTYPMTNATEFLRITLD